MAKSTEKPHFAVIFWCDDAKPGVNVEPMANVKVNPLYNTWDMKVAPKNYVLAKYGSERNHRRAILVEIHYCDTKSKETELREKVVKFPQTYIVKGMRAQLKWDDKINPPEDSDSETPEPTASVNIGNTIGVIRDAHNVLNSGTAAPVFHTPTGQSAQQTAANYGSSAAIVQATGAQFPQSAYSLAELTPPIPSIPTTAHSAWPMQPQLLPWTDQRFGVEHIVKIAVEAATKLIDEKFGMMQANTNERFQELHQLIGQMALKTAAEGPEGTGKRTKAQMALDAMKTKRSVGSAIREGMKHLFTREECLTSAWSDRGVKMSGTRTVLLDRERLAELRDLTDKWVAYYKFPGGVSGDKFKNAVRGHLDEEKVKHRKRPSPPSPDK